MEVKFFIDSIDKGLCSLIPEYDGAPVLFPRSLLPKEAAEGDWLTFSIKKDKKTEGKYKDEIDSLLNDLLLKDK
ncbi:MAG: DUF3006 family protein [Synergistaceae bacterium]